MQIGRLMGAVLFYFLPAGTGSAWEFDTFETEAAAFCYTYHQIRNEQASGLLMLQAFTTPDGNLIRNVNIQLESSPEVSTFSDITSYNAVFVFPREGTATTITTETDKDEEQTSFIAVPPPPALLEQLKTANATILTLPSPVGQFHVDLTGSSAAISRWNDCTAAIVAAEAQSFIQYAADNEPSFNCRLARSAAEKLICADPGLAKLDRQLNDYYEAAKARAAESTFIGDAPQDPSAWFEADNNAEWTWREENCQDKPCLLRWYTKRRAVLQWIAESDYGLGDGGIKSVRQLRNGDTIISYSMAAYVGNVIWKVSEGAYVRLPNGDIEVVSEEPFFYKVLWQKAYFNEGGAFWFDTLRGKNNMIIDILRPENDEWCMARDEFFAKTNFPSKIVERVTADEICIH